jgi:hypothetical protein
VVEVAALNYQGMEVVVEHFQVMMALVVVAECFPLMAEEEVVVEYYCLSQQLMMILQRYQSIDFLY